MRAASPLAIVVLLLVASFVVAGLPRPVENDFLKMESAGLAVTNDPPRGAKLGFGFAFHLKRPLSLTRVKVEDVTDDTPTVVVDDKHPKLKNDTWGTQTELHPLTKDNFPWMYDFFDTAKKFRLTISSEGQRDIVLIQKAQFSGREKAQLMTILAPKPKR
jgi:hypothetical protein